MNALDTLKTEESEAYKLLIRKARSGNLLAFTLLTKLDYEVNWHHKLMCKYLDRFVKGEIKRLMLFCPPRSGKSELVSRRLPALIHGLDPNAEIMMATYNSDLASDMTIDIQRIMDRPVYKNLFPRSHITPEGKLSKYARNGNEHELVPYTNAKGDQEYPTGSFRAQGVGGSFTGRGAQCVVGSTLVPTEIGILKIEDLCKMEKIPRVLSYNHATGIKEWRNVIATKISKTSKTIKILTTGNRQLECTPEHRIYCLRSGYTEASLLNRRDSLVVNESPHGTSRIDSDTFSRIEKTSERSIDVYDIQVEGNNNFFANGILVHNCILVDDPFRNRADADSKNYRDTLYKFYTSTLYTRLEKDGKILICLTRWHSDDLVSRLLQLAKTDSNADQWTILSLPGIRDDLDNPEDPRELGDPLWAAKYSKEVMSTIRSTIGSRDWSALYQQKPTAEDGNIFKATWFKYYKVLPTRFDQMIQSWDFAVKDKSTSDYTVGLVFGRIGAVKYLVHMERGRWSFPAACQKVIDVSKRFPQAHKKLIEAKAAGPSIIQTLRQQVSGMIEIEPRGDKVARANAISPEVESGNVWLPDPMLAPWINDAVIELCDFPNGAHDDIVDAFSQGLDELRKALVMHMPTAGHGSGTIF